MEMNQTPPATTIPYDAPESDIEKAKQAFVDYYRKNIVFTVQHSNQQANQCFRFKDGLEEFTCPESAFGGKRRTRSSCKKRSKRTVRKQRK